MEISICLWFYFIITFSLGKFLLYTTRHGGHHSLICLMTLLSVSQFTEITVCLSQDTNSMPLSSRAEKQDKDDRIRLLKNILNDATDKLDLDGPDSVSSDHLNFLDGPDHDCSVTEATATSRNDSIQLTENNQMDSNSSIDTDDPTSTSQSMILYQAIKDTRALIIHSNTVLYTGSCERKCGYSQECSCTPLCIYLKTCCMDFLDYCGDTLDLVQSELEFDWLGSVEKQCHPKMKSIVVASCSAEKAQASKEMLEQTQLLISSQVRQSVFEAKRQSKATRKSSWEEMFLLLLSLYNDGESSHDYFDVRFITTPVTDISTGIAYNNISTYICNGANLTFAKLWPTFIPIKRNSLPVESEIRAKGNIFNLINQSMLSDACPEYFTEGFFHQNMHLCEDNVIATCPDNFTDLKIIEACHTNLFQLSVSKIVGQHLVPVLFKNPFCLYCNMDKNEKQFVNLEFKPPYYKVRGDDSCTNHLQLNSRSISGSPPNTRQSDLTINKYVSQSYMTPVWNFLACNLVLPVNDVDVTSELNLTLSGNRNASSKPISALSDVREMSSELYTQYIPSITTKRQVMAECISETCHGISMNTYCVLQWLTILVLPSASSNLTERFLQDFLQTWAIFIRRKFPGAMNETKDLVAYYRRLSKPVIPGYRNFSYSMTVSLFSEYTGVEEWVTPLKEMLVSFMEKSNFTFQKGKRYFCFTKVIIPRMEYYRCDPEYVFDVPDLQALHSSSGSSRLLGMLTFGLITLWIILLPLFSTRI